MEKILTIVIPTYNMQDYLRRCLDSLIVPEEQMKQLEVLVVNDGSKDNSSAIAHEYQDKYPGTFRVIDKENGNYGSCVNRGLKEATGKYIKILDADDWFDTGKLPSYIQQLAIQDADMVLNCCKLVDINGKKQRNIGASFMINGETISFSEFAKFHYFPPMHNVAYRLSILKSMKYSQTEGISYTDMEWVEKPISAVSSVTYIDVCLYNYCLGREGQTVSDDIISKRFDHHCMIAYSLLDFSLNYMGDEAHKQYIEQKAIDYLRYLYRKHIIGGVFEDAAFRKFDDIIRGKYSFVCSSISGLKFKSFYISIWRYFRLGKTYGLFLDCLIKVLKLSI